MAKTENLTILFVDIVGFTKMTSNQSRDQNEAMLWHFQRLLRPLIAGFGGRYIKSLGDAILASFRSPTDGVRCGMAMHDALCEHNLDRPSEEEIHIRVALNVGEVRVERKDIFGEAVNVAARVEGLTPKGEVYITEALYLAMNKAEVPAKLVGEHTLKGIPDPVRIYRVPPRHVPRLVTPADTLPGRRGEPPFGGLHTTVRRRRTPDMVRDDLRWRLRPGLMRRTADGLGAAWRRRSVAGTKALLLSATGAFLMLGVLGLGFGAIYLTAPQWLPGSSLTDSSQEKAMNQLATPEGLGKLHILAGHFAFSKNERDKAVDEYRKALELDPSSADDPDLARNLVECLSWASDSATPVIRAHRSDAIVAALSRRTNAPGLTGAGRAAQLLEEFGVAQKVDRVGMALNEFSQASQCKERLVAVRKLRALKNRRAIPVLEENISGVGNWFKNGCLYDEATETIAEIKRATKGS